MTTINISCMQAIPCSIYPISSIAPDGCGFALTSPRLSGIVKLNETLCPFQTICTARKYIHLCYDAQEHCYWANAQETPSILYKLDLHFCEIEELLLSCGCEQRLCGISCDPCNNTLLLAYPHSIERANKHTGACEPLCQPNGTQLNLGIQALCCGYLLSYLKDGLQCVAAQCPGCDELVELCLPHDHSFQAMVLREICSREDQCIAYEISLLLSKRCGHESIEMHLQVSCCEQGPLPCPPVRPCPVPCPPDPPCPVPCPPDPPCPVPCPPDPPCPVPCPPDPPCPPPWPPVPPCPPPWPPIPPCPPPWPPVTPCLPCACGKYEIMHSVALEEAGIAHILNAEGEKLQKAVAESTCIGELLEVNESVRRTITQITLLEGQLYSKLEVLSSICEDECCDDPPYPCDCETLSNP